MTGVDVQLLMFDEAAANLLLALENLLKQRNHWLINKVSHNLDVNRDLLRRELLTMD